MGGLSALGSLAGGAALAAAGGCAAVGLAAALPLLRARRALDAALVAVAGLALALLFSEPTLLHSPAGTREVNAELTPSQARAAASLSLQGDGLRAAQWDDLPARALQWKEPSEPTVSLSFPRQLLLGRAFELTLRRSQPLAGWRLQLQDENGHLLAQAAADAAGREARLRWLPPLAEALLLQARVLDAQGQTLEHGPLPLLVRAGKALQVRGRFGAPSFDLQALNSLLVDSDARLDWQVTLGKTLSRSETARTAITAPDLLVIDAAHFERAAAPVRAALLAQVAQGLPLLVLSANASDPALWARELQLPLAATLGEVERSPGPDASLLLPLTALVPPAVSGRALGPWLANDAAAPWLWQRPWGAGRIAWLGLSDWHRAAISAPQALGAWWQTVLDQTGVRQVSPLAWDFPDAMPLAGERTRICARGARAEQAVDLPGLQQSLQLQARADRADAACAAFWPRQPGWQRVQGTGSDTPASALYVYAPQDWPQWQRALRREATARYAARLQATTQAVTTPWPAWPCALAFTVAMLGLWWRERR